MADKTVEMILKAAEGNFHVVAVLDKDGNDITATYAKKQSWALFSHTAMRKATRVTMKQRKEENNVKTIYDRWCRSGDMCSDRRSDCAL